MLRHSLEVQYFEGCPHERLMRSNARKAIAQADFEIEYRETIIHTMADAIRARFCGSPTLIFDGEDFSQENLPAEPSITCRIYPNGIPSAEEIIERMRDIKSRTISL